MEDGVVEEESNDDADNVESPPTTDQNNEGVPKTDQNNEPPKSDPDTEITT